MFSGGLEKHKGGGGIETHTGEGGGVGGREIITDRGSCKGGAQLKISLIFYFNAFLYIFQLNVLIIIVKPVMKLNVRNLIGVVIGNTINVFINKVSSSLTLFHRPHIINKWSTRRISYRVVT